MNSSGARLGRIFEKARGEVRLLIEVLRERLARELGKQF
jgi:hypothetical protein